MSVVENFSELSPEELQQFATTLVQKINSEHLFHNEAILTIEDLEADEMSGDLYISLSHKDTVNVPRKATWQGLNEEDLENVSEVDAEFDNTLSEDARKAFKTVSVTVDGYNVSLSVDDVEDVSIEDVEVDNYTEEDDGIGSYEFWGSKGHDSHPYLEANGTITYGCYVYMSLLVEPAV